MLYETVHEPMVLVSLQMILMLVFLVGAWSKLRARETFAGVVYNYRLLPEFAVTPISYGLPACEFALGLGLAYAPTRPYAAIGAVLVLAVFNLAIGINLARGRREIDCGCFSSVLKQRLSGALMARNFVLMGLASGLAWSAPQPLPSTAGWLDWLVGFATALAVALVYMMSASLSAVRDAGAHQSRHAR